MIYTSHAFAWRTFTKFQRINDDQNNSPMTAPMGSIRYNDAYKDVIQDTNAEAVVMEVLRV